MLDGMDKKLKLELLEKLMDSMDESVGERLKKKDLDGAMEPMAVVEEKSVMPASELKEKLMEKLGNEDGLNDEDESMSDEFGDDESVSDDLELNEGEEEAVEEAEPMSRLQKRIAEGKKFREQMKR